MEKIRNGTVKSETVLKIAEEELTKTIIEFKLHEKEIGKELLDANIETQNELNYLGPCTKCKDGELQLRRGRYGMFAACNKYPDCKTTFSLPSNAIIKPAKKTCEECKHPLVLVIKRAKRPQELCINKECKTKYLEGDAGQEAKEIAKGIIEKKCTKCDDGMMVLRSSLYGKFLGCNKFPKCKHMEKLTDDSPLKEDFKKKEK